MIQRSEQPEGDTQFRLPLDGRQLDPPFLKYSDLFEHTTLEFDMYSTPAKPDSQ